MLRRFLAMTGRERWLVIRVWPVVFGTRLRLSLMPYARLESSVMTRPLGTPGPHRAEDLAIAVRRASRLVPAATCLVQCLAAARVLRGAGLEPTLHLGVKTGSDGFAAHAWLDCDGEVLIGGEVMGDYHPLERR